MSDEDRSIGAVGSEIYKFYINKAGGTSVLVSVVFSFVLIMCGRLASSFWLAFWSDGSSATAETTQLFGFDVELGLTGSQYLAGYSVISGSRL